MSQSELLLSLIIIQQGLLGVVWLGASALGLVRRPALHFGASSVLVAAGLAAVVGRDAGFISGGARILPGVLGILGFIMLRRGVQLFCERRPSDLESMWLLGLATLALGAAARPGQGFWITATVVSGGLAWSMLNAGREVIGSLQVEFGRRKAVACAVPLWMIGGLFALRAVLAPIFPDQVGRVATGGGAFNAALGLALLAMTLIQHLGLGAMVVIRTVSQLRQLSDHDALTGLLNRRGLAAHHERERGQLRRGSAGYALLLVDIDHFKRINDEHGHEVGDSVLVNLARSMKTVMRPGDVVARTGGEEFCVLLANVEPAHALRTAQRLREAVRDAELRVGEARLTLTCSIGVACTQDADEDLDVVSKRADQAMYRAKALGRDRVVAAAAA
jgi:diguanylate cyclase (GGDEF)-like protein